MTEDVVSTPFGQFLVTAGELIGETTRAGTLWDGPGFLQPIAIEHGRLGEVGTTILDVGANQGAFSIWLAAHGAWRVIAVEPQPQVMQRLKANLDLNRAVTADRVIPVEAAAYDRKVALACGPLDPGNWGGTALRVTPEAADVPVLAIPLDDLRECFGRRVSLIKIDAQGCDFAVLRGLQATIDRYAPVIVFEWEADLAAAHGDTFDACLQWLTDRYYNVTEWVSQPHNYLARPVII